MLLAAGFSAYSFRQGVSFWCFSFGGLVCYLLWVYCCGFGVWCVAAEFGGWYLVVWPFVGGQRFTLWFGDFVTVGGEFRVFGFPGVFCGFGWFCFLCCLCNSFGFAPLGRFGLVV